MFVVSFNKQRDDKKITETFKFPEIKWEAIWRKAGEEQF